MKKKLSKWLSILLPLALGVVLIFYSYQKFTPEQIAEIRQYFNDTNYFYIALSLVISVIGSASRAYRWKYSLEHMGYKSSFANNFMAVSIGYLMNMTIPRSGEFSRALVLKKYNNIPFDKGFGTIVAERIIDSVILLSLTGVALLLQFDIVKAFVLDKISVEKALWVVVIGILAMLIFVIIYFYSRSKIILSLKNKISGLKEGLLSIFHMKHKWPFIFHTIAIWGSFVLMFYITIYALPETSGMSFGAVLTSFIVGSIAIAVTSSGFGTYPVLVANILLFYNIDESAGIAFGWIVWSSQIILVIISGVISFLLLPVFNRIK